MQRPLPDRRMAKPLLPRALPDVDRAGGAVRRRLSSQLHDALEGASTRFCSVRRIWIMSNDNYLMLQSSIIFLLLFLVGTTAIIQHPGWFQ
jgi:hypothetical protein